MRYEMICDGPPDQEMCLENLSYFDRRFFLLCKSPCNVSNPPHLALLSDNARHALPRYQMAPSVAYWLTDKMIDAGTFDTYYAQVSLCQQNIVLERSVVVPAIGSVQVPSEAFGVRMEHSFNK